MPNTREKLMRLLCTANSKAAEAEAFEDATYADQLGIQADHLIANGVTVQKWIPVSERLPEQGQQVIVYSGGILKPSVFAYHFWNKDYDSWAHITHWMALPEPPKGE